MIQSCTYTGLPDCSCKILLAHRIQRKWQIQQAKNCTLLQHSTFACHALSFGAKYPCRVINKRCRRHGCIIRPSIHSVLKCTLDVRKWRDVRDRGLRTFKVQDKSASSSAHFNTTHARKQHTHSDRHGSGWGMVYLNCERMHSDPTRFAFYTR